MITNDLVEQAQQTLANVRITRYAHEMRADESTGTYIMDCSAFVSYILQTVAPQQLAQISKEPGHDWARAFRFYEFFRDVAIGSQSTNGWQAVQQFNAVQKGDILVWSLVHDANEPDTVASPPPHQEHRDTGHVMIVAGTPQFDHSDNDLSLYNVSVYDSSEIKHYYDSRPRDVTGLGSGMVKIQTNRQGLAVAFQFNAVDPFYTQPIAIGRVLTTNI